MANEAAWQELTPLGLLVLLGAALLQAGTASGADFDGGPADARWPPVSQATVGEDGGPGDLNGDGRVNVLDVHRFRFDRSTTAASEAGRAAGTSIETIFVENDVEFIQAGDSFSILMKLTQNTIPLFGYSLDVEAVPLAGTIGSMSAVVEMTNFYDPQNLITAATGCAPGCAGLDPVFSVILDGGDGGVFVSANTDDGSTVLAQDDMNDVLAEVFFTPAPGSSGPFEFRLGPASALSDGNGFAVPFVFVTDTVDAFPNPVDFDLNGVVGFADLVQLLNNWGVCPDPCDVATCQWDVDGSCSVGFSDLTILLESWG